MLTRLSIRDIVLIDRLDIDFASGLSALTGETGAGKSILLDAFALALGARGDSSLVRRGAEQGQVTAAFDVPFAHPARAIHNANANPAEDDKSFASWTCAGGLACQVMSPATRMGMCFIPSARKVDSSTHD